MLNGSIVLKMTVCHYGFITGVKTIEAQLLDLDQRLFCFNPLIA